LKILTNYDFNGNQIVNVALQNLATAPANPKLGQAYFNTTSKRAFIWTGTGWTGMDAVGATMTGADIVSAINASTSKIDDDNLSTAVNDAISKAHNTHEIADITGLQTALDAKETPLGAQNRADTAEGNAKSYADTKIAELVASAPETLDTLKELADALGEDPNFATTITSELASKTEKYTAALGDGVNTVYEITHNLNSRDLAVTLRETASPYAQVITDIEFTSLNTITVKFADPPTTNQYTVTIIG
jgi:hypothetical protein